MIGDATEMHIKTSNMSLAKDKIRYQPSIELEKKYFLWVSNL